MYYLVYFLLFIIVIQESYCQVNSINPESMYNGTGGLNGDAILTWESNNRFENDGLTMSGTGDMRNTVPSGYPGASGTWNVMLNSPGEYFQINGIDASPFINLSLSLGIRKSTLAEDGSGLLIETSTDGIIWTSLFVSLPTGSGTAAWHFTSPTGIIPNAPSLQIRITALNSTEFRLDDIHLNGFLPCPTQITSFSPSSGPVGTFVTITGSGFATANQVMFNGVSANTFQILSDTLLTAVVPPGAGSGSIQILTTCVSSSSVDYLLIDFSCAFNGSNLILSELCDPINNYQTDRFIEIYNPTSQAIQLDGWTVRAIANYLECETWILSGHIQPGEAMTCGYSNPINGGSHDFVLEGWNGNLPGSCCSFWNGNRRDGATLYHGTSRIDLALYENSPVSWFGDHSLQRLDTICNPNPIENPSEWSIGQAVLNAGYPPSSPGGHNTHCTGIPPEILIHPLSQQVCENEDVSFTVSATGGAPPYGFQWMELDTTGIWQVITAGGYYAVNSSGTGSILTISGVPSALNQQQYYCKVLNIGEGCWRASNAFSLEVLPSPGVTGVFHN